MRSAALPLALVLIALSCLPLACFDDDDDDPSTSSGQADDDNDTADDDISDDDNDDTTDDDNDDITDYDTSPDDDDTTDNDTGDDDTFVEDWDEPYAPTPSDEIGIFVSYWGDNGNPGTMAEPVESLQIGLNLAADQNKVVFAADGIKSAADGTISTRVSMFGGYDPHTWERDLEHITTTRIGTLSITYTQDDPLIVEGFSWLSEAINEYALTVDINTDSRVILHKNRIVSGDNFNLTANSIAIRAATNTRITLINNEILSGQAQGLYMGHSYGVKSRGDVFMRGNSVTSRASSYFSVPVRVDNSYSKPISVLINNELHAPSISIGEKAGFCGSGSVTLINNTIFTGGRFSSGVELENCTAVLINNIIQNSSILPDAAAITLTDSGISALSLINNDLVVAANGIFLFIDEQEISQLNDVNDCQWAGCAEAQDNISADPQFAGWTDYHLSAASPCIDAGLNPSPWYDEEDIYFDFEGTRRPLGEGWDIGMDEYIP